MSAYSDTVIADGAVAYWRLGETSGTVARSEVGSFDGTISGGVTLNQPGALSDGNKAMAFDGTTGKVAIATPLLLPRVVTVEGWIRTTRAGQQQPMWSNRGAGTATYIGMSTANVAFWFQQGASTVNGVRLINDGQWHHVVFTNKIAAPDETSIFVDGVLDKTQSSTLRADITLPPNVGWDPLVGQFWSGDIDDVAIYPTTLTPAQIAAHYTIGTTPIGPTASERRRRRSRAHAC